MVTTRHMSLCHMTYHSQATTFFISRRLFTVRITSHIILNKALQASLPLPHAVVICDITDDELKIYFTLFCKVKGPHLHERRCFRDQSDILRLIYFRLKFD